MPIDRLKKQVAELSAKPTAAICYVIDSGYLLPTLVSAIQARVNTSIGLADVFIVCLDEPSVLIDAAQVIASENGVTLLLYDKSAIGGLHIMYGRLLLDNFLPGHYSRIVYIDGDTQIRGNLDGLFLAPLGEIEFLAVRDPVAMFGKVIPRIGKAFETYRRSIGVEQPERYFNSGLLVISRIGWPKIAEKALLLASREGKRFRFPDQDALNVSAAECCKLISNRWNFPGFLINSRAEDQTAPRIYHFMSNPRPWNEAVAPWGRPWQEPYLKLLEQNPSLVRLTPSRSMATKVRYIAQQAVKMATEYSKVGGTAELSPELEVY